MIRILTHLILGQDASYDFGSSAGFYVNATEGEWAKHYKMYDYVTKELPDLVEELFPVDSKKKSICGHSMGGHGALISYLKNPGKYTSVSAFSPICNPTQCPWGQKAFKGYLGKMILDIKSYKVHLEQNLEKNDFV